MTSSKKEEEYAKVQDKFVDIVSSSEFLESGEAHKAEINAERAALGLATLPPDETHLNDVPDVPACDNCGKAESGKYNCSACQSAFYCSPQCQKAHWKLGGHKKECPQYQELCQTLGKQTVVDMNNADQPPVMRVQRLERLDGEGAYKVAVKNGLHDAILELFKQDRDNVLVRFRGDQALDRVSYTHFIAMTLWRGQRHSRAGSVTVGKCDGARIKRFVRSSPDAFPTLWEAAMAVAKVPLDDDVYRSSPEMHNQVHQVARDILAFCSQIFTSDRASKAILCGPTTKDEDAMMAHGQECVKYLALTINSATKAFNSAPEERDLRSVLEGYIYQNAAMIAYRAREYGIDDDFSSKLEMNPVKSAMYKTIAVPLGEGTIKKGYALTNEEAQVAMRQATAQMKGQKKASKKKGKKGRG